MSSRLDAMDSNEAAEQLNEYVGHPEFRDAYLYAATTAATTFTGEKLSVAALWVTDYGMSAATNHPGVADIVLGGDAPANILQEVNAKVRAPIIEVMFRHFTLTPGWDEKVKPIGITRAHIASWIVTRLEYYGQIRPQDRTEYDRRQLFYDTILSEPSIYRKELVRADKFTYVIDLLRAQVPANDYMRQIQIQTWSQRHPRL